MLAPVPHRLKIAMPVLNQTRAEETGLKIKYLPEQEVQPVYPL